MSGKKPPTDAEIKRKFEEQSESSRLLNPSNSGARANRHDIIAAAAARVNEKRGADLSQLNALADAMILTTDPNHKLPVIEHIDIDIKPHNATIPISRKVASPLFPLNSRITKAGRSRLFRNNLP